MNDRTKWPLRALWSKCHGGARYAGGLKMVPLAGDQNGLARPVRAGILAVAETPGVKERGRQEQTSGQPSAWTCTRPGHPARAR
jgi:hypothetical protein